MTTNLATTGKWSCGCTFTRPDTNSRWTRRPCPAHTGNGSCAYCTTGRPHPTCSTCGLSDGLHAHICTEPTR